MPNFAKFKLIMWKNVLIVWRSKFQTMSEIMIPIFFCLLLVFLRNVVESDNEVQHFEFADLDVYFNGYGIGNDTKLKKFWNVWYAPKTAETDRIMEFAQHCMRLNGIKGYTLESRMIKDVIFEQQERPLGAIIFNVSNLNSETHTRLNMTFRFPGELREEVLDFSDRKQSVTGLNWATDILKAPSTIGGPRNYFQSNGGVPPGYMSQKFTFLQSCVSSAYIELFLMNNTQNDTNDDDDDDDRDYIPFVPVRVLRYSHPPVVIDWMLDVFRVIVPMLILMSYLYPAMNNIEVGVYFSINFVNNPANASLVKRIQFPSYYA